MECKTLSPVQLTLVFPFTTVGFGSDPDKSAFLAGKTTMRRMGYYLRGPCDEFFSKALVMFSSTTTAGKKAYVYILALVLLLKNVKNYFFFFY